MNPLNHVAIIMDGNGRWGLKNKNSRNAGHKKGLVTLEKIIEETIKNNIKFLTLYTFSTENWKRPEREIRYLFNLLQTFLEKKIKKLNRNNIKIKFLGKKKFGKKLNTLLSNAEKLTKNNNLLQVNLALNYGSKSEIINSINILKRKNLLINENNISKNLYTKNIPDPNILIRTGNTHRLSNFLLWQIAYTEIFFINKLWPDFNENDFLKIINKYKNIKRNFGNI
jgi:undecaprenyl diphosphate synthase